MKKIEHLLDYLAEISQNVLSQVIECLANPEVGIASHVRTITKKFVTHTSRSEQ